VKVVLVAKETSFTRFVTEAQDARTLALLDAKSPAVARLRSTHDEHVATVETLRAWLSKQPLDVLELQGNVDLELPSDAKLVVTVGGDGTFLATSRRLGRNVPVLGINSAPSSSVGFFCAGDKANATELLDRAIEGTLGATQLARMKVVHNGIVRTKRVLNEALFCHASPAATTRYVLTLRSGSGRAIASEEQKSSGIWVGPPAGSTAALRSAGGRILPLEARRLQFVVREPYQRECQQIQLRKRVLDAKSAVEIISKTRRGRLFLDGEPADPVELGDDLQFSLSDEPLTVLGLDGR
jgi:NAD+ kinase